MNNSPPSSPPRKRFRLQFSLRMMLLLMAAVGATLAVYRWPWKEISQHQVLEDAYPRDPFDDAPPKTTPKVVFDYERRTTYRRNWRTLPAKNGLEQIWGDGRLWHEASFYDGELNGIRRAYDNAGRLTLEAMFRGNLLHGPYRAGDGQTWVWQGSYTRGRPNGAWQGMIERQSWREPTPPAFSDYFEDDGSPFVDSTRIPIPNDAIVIASNWNQGQRQGVWTWQTRNGEVLYTAEYDQNNLVRWNGEPVVQQFWQWLASPRVNDTRLFAHLSAAGDDWERQYQLADDDLRLKIKFADQPNDLLIYVVWIGKSGPLFSFHRRSLVPALCEVVALNGYGFDYRYGALWLVPRFDPEPPFVDPTGMSKTEFEPGSQQDRDWNEVIDVQSCEGYEFECVHQLLKKTSIAFDIDAVHELSEFGKSDRPPSELLFTRRRRDALGLVLYQTGCRCERRGNALFILPREGRTEAQIVRKPLAKTFFDPFGKH